jgi:hypothetical protein
MKRPKEVMLRVRVPSKLIALADECALGQQVSLTFFTRAALAAALEAEGVTPPPLKRPSYVRKARYYGGKPGTWRALA